MAAITSAIVGGAASVAGTVSAAKSAKKGREAQQEAMDKATKAFEGIRIPTIEEQRIILQYPELMGQYTPEQVEAMQLGVSAMEDVAARPETIQEQQEALQQISEVAEGGLTEADKAAMREIQRDVGQQARARQKSILSEMAQRGTLGSGMELAAQLKGEQQSIAESAEASDRAIQQAQARALEALTRKGTLASEMRSQEFGEQSDIARARDAIEKFNLANRQDISQQNIGERNRAQLLNLQARQAQEEARVSTANKMEEYNKALAQQQFQNQITRAQGMVTPLTNQGIVANQAGQDTSARQAGLTSGIVNTIGTIGGFLGAKPTQAPGTVGTFGVTQDDDKVNLGAQNYWDPGRTRLS